MRETNSPVRSRPATVLIVDDHPLVREGLRRLLAGEAGIGACFEAEDGAQALLVLRAASIDAMIVDLTLRHGSGLELIEQAARLYPSVRVLVLSMHDERSQCERALAAGAMGYVMKQEATETLLTAVRRILDGNLYLSDAMQGRMLNRYRSAGRAAAPLEALSAREKQILALIGQGYRAHEIARQLNRSARTIEAHCANIRQKLTLRSAAELTRFAIESVWRGPLAAQLQAGAESVLSPM